MVIVAVNLIKGKGPQDNTVAANVYWWDCQDRTTAIENGVPYAEKTLKEMLQSPELHAVIISRAVEQRIR